jgi:hypothetical protein
MATGSLKDRVAALETEVARLKAKVEEQGQKAEQPWWKQISGAFANDPDFEEAMRLGREYRESFRPKPRKRRKRQ